jgi:hypothetical protein
MFDKPVKVIVAYLIFFSGLYTIFGVFNIGLETLPTVLVSSRPALYIYMAALFSAHIVLVGGLLFGASSWTRRRTAELEKNLVGEWHGSYDHKGKDRNIVLKLSQNSRRINAQIKTSTSDGVINQQGVVNGMDTLQFVIQTKDVILVEKKSKWLAETWNCVLKRDDDGVYALEVEISDAEEGHSRRVIASPKLYKTG